MANRNCGGGVESTAEAETPLNHLDDEASSMLGTMSESEDDGENRLMIDEGGDNDLENSLMEGLDDALDNDDEEDDGGLESSAADNSFVEEDDIMEMEDPYTGGVLHKAEESSYFGNSLLEYSRLDQVRYAQEQEEMGFMNQRHRYEEFIDDEDGLDYCCEICEGVFLDINQLFRHLGSHDSAQYAFTSGRNSNSIYGEAPIERRWPNRFHKYPSETYYTLSRPRKERRLNNTVRNFSSHTEMSSRRSIPPLLNATKGPHTLANRSRLNQFRFNLLQSRIASKPRIPDLQRPGSRLPFLFRRPGLGSSLIRSMSKFPVNRRYKCPYCSKEFQRSDHFRQHITNHTSNDERGFMCKLCGKKFNVLITLRRHMGTHAAYKPYKCSKCPRRFNQSGHLKRHEESPFTHTEAYMNMDYRRRCRLCFEMFPNDNTRLEHERRVHRTDRANTVLKCRYPSCARIQPSMKDLIEHYKRNHVTDRLLNGGGFIPVVTPRSQLQSQQASLAPSTHPLAVNEEDDISLDSELPTMNGDGDTHSLTASALGEECRMCFEYFSSITERNHHEHRVHNINSPSTILQCKYANCKKILGAKNWLARHIREHRLRIEEGLDPDLTPFKPSLVKIEPSSILKTKGEHGKNKPEFSPIDGGWECRICDQNFVEACERSVHERVFHDTRNPIASFACKLCNSQEGNFEVLLNHLSIQHPVIPTSAMVDKQPEPPPVVEDQPIFVFPCRHCPTTFTDQNVRINHEYELHNTRDALDEFFPCKLCGKTMTLRGLRKHIRRIHGETIHELGKPPPPGELQPTKPSKETTQELPRPPPLKSYNPAKAEPKKQKVSRKPPPQTKAVVSTSSPIAKKAASPKTNAPAKSSQPKSSGSTHKLTSRAASASANVVYKRSSEPTNVTWVCRLCFEQFDEQRQRENHEHTVHGTNSTYATFICKYKECKEEFSTFRALIKHLRQHGETAVPTSQQKPPASTSGKDSHSGPAVIDNDTKDTLWKCRLCWEVFPTQQRRSTHEEQSHQSVLTNAALPCKYCPRTFQMMTFLVEHLETHGEGRHIAEDGTDHGPPTLERQNSIGDGSSIEPLPKKAATPPTPRVYTCRICELVLPHAKARILHENTVHHAKNLRIEQKCKACTAVLPNFKHLITHVANFHNPRHQPKVQQAVPPVTTQE